MSGRKQWPHDLPHSWAHPPSMPRSNAAGSWLMPICPECILKALHGDEQRAIQQAHQAMACLDSGARGCHGQYIVAHALNWCKEICSSAAEQPAPPTSPAEQRAWVWVQTEAMRAHSGGDSSGAAWMQQAAPASSASSSQWRPHTPAPRIPHPRFALGSDVRMKGATPHKPIAANSFTSLCGCISDPHLPSEGGRRTS